MVINVNNTFEWSPDELYHHGILGQKWGRRRWQNPDGTLTAEGRARYLVKETFGEKEGYVLRIKNRRPELYISKKGYEKLKNERINYLNEKS